MKHLHRHGLGKVAALLAAAVFAYPCAAQEAEVEMPRLPQDSTSGWSYEAEASLLVTSGNAGTRTFGGGLAATRSWGLRDLELRAQGTRAEASRLQQFAVGRPDDFQVMEVSHRETISEDYSFRATWRQPLAGFTKGTVSGSWERNTFAGFRTRLSLLLGLGHSWISSERVTVSVDYGLTGTLQVDLVEEPAKEPRYPGFRAAVKSEVRIAEATVLTTDLTVDENLATPTDLRLDFNNALTVQINSTFAVRAAFRGLWDNRPALAELPLRSTVDAESTSSVRVPRRKLDTTVSLALVAQLP